MGDFNMFSHLNDKGEATMVDVSSKDATVRRALASGKITMSKEAFDLLIENKMPKGDVFAVARVAGIQAAKRTQELIPLCHLLLLEKVTIDLIPNEEDNSVKAICEVRLTGKTGAEMEALTGASVALLTVYDMCKAIDKSMVISDIMLEEKDGGKSGSYRR